MRTLAPDFPARFVTGPRNDRATGGPKRPHLRIEDEAVRDHEAPPDQAPPDPAPPAPPDPAPPHPAP